MKQKKVPMRMCTGCGTMRPKKELIRIVHSSEGSISLDKTGKKPGRGAYLCNEPECLRKAKKAKRLEKAFGVAIPEEIYVQLEEEIRKDAG